MGKGGYGVVVAAINRLDGRQYAVKKIKMQSQSPQGFSRLIREVTTLSRLQHPNIVRYFQVGPLRLPLTTMLTLVIVALITILYLLIPAITIVITKPLCLEAKICDCMHLACA